ncbi:sigma-70 family RNA polymerase sigma factor [Stieleria sp. TO1_6]|uniref:RNA polymerase sigma factor n=1 Tax=Stieleria tagensis TaxID=2956795 RepID=UPI00209B6440|nr:sigma-70 family RNA polymerase sigma factor [Stieleria tagensis]MCO8125207.1 sigma-70 family RNA polymerase sigma factor [Stieleria tagensis]
MAVPETRPSILIRLRDHSDREAWRHFEEVYRGVIRNVAIRFGMQEADAADLGQEVLIRVSKGIGGFDPDLNQAKFRTWLGQVIRSAVVDHHRRRPREQGSGLTEIHDQLAQLVDPADHSSFDQAIRSECQSEVFRWAARRIRGEFAESSWLAFWRTSVEQQPVETVARELGRTTGAVYTSRSRIMKRLREEVCLFDQDPIADDAEASKENSGDDA